VPTDWRPTVPAKKPTTKKAATAKPTPRKPAAKKAVTSERARAVRPGDLIVIDSRTVGSPPREGEVLEVIQGEVSVSYRVHWADGHESLIAPILGSARVIPVGRAARRRT
jgi:hypothetical protein